MVGVVTTDDGERPAWLLKQVRDLTENWEIPLGEELEKYLDQLERVEISFDNGKSTLNFIEAAMLIQGSACVYSKKVEYLYALAIATLEMIVSRKKQQQASSIDDQGQDKDATFDQHLEQDDLLDLDDIKEADNIELKDDTESNTNEGVKIIPRIPFALMPKNEMNRRGEDVLFNHKGEVIGNRNDFKLNTCILHSSGALLIDISSVSMLEKSMATRPASTPAPERGMNACDQDKNAENANPTPATNADATSAQKDIAMDVDEGNASFGGDNGGGYDDYDDIDDAAPSSPISSRPGGDVQNSRLREFQRRAKLIENAAKQAVLDDPWEELDPYTEHKHLEKLFKKGKQLKIPANLKALLAKEKKRKRDQNGPVRFGAVQLCPIVEFCGKDALGQKSKSKSRQKGSRFPEFDYLSRIEDEKRKEYRKRERRLLASRFTADQIADIESIAEPPADDDDDDGYDGFDYDDGVDDGIGAQENRPASQDDLPIGGTFEDHLQVSLSDAVFTSYEDLVRQHIGKYIEDAENYAQQTELSKRVKEWQDKILPVLEEEEQHRPFDIHVYGSEILHAFDEAPQKTFNDIVKSKERHEVCRYFLSTLLLANMNNVEIIQPENQLEMDMLNLRILDKTPAYKAISNYKAPSLQD